jgi:hypothetical protein
MASHSDARPKANALSKRSASKGTRWFSGLVIAGLAMLGLRSWQAILREAEGECPEQAQRVEGHAVVFGLGDCGPRDARPSLMASHSDARPASNTLSLSKGFRAKLKLRS